jgi:hypothetical protein
VALDLHSPLKVVSWASVHADCPMRYATTGTGELVIVFGSGQTEFELALDGGALRTLANLTAEALAQLDAEEQPTELVTTAERPT